jgi:hypothetical protein
MSAGAEQQAAMLLKDRLDVMLVGLLSCSEKVVNQSERGIVKQFWVLFERSPRICPIRCLKKRG